MAAGTPRVARAVASYVEGHLYLTYVAPERTDTSSRWSCFLDSVYTDLLKRGSGLQLRGLAVRLEGRLILRQPAYGPVWRGGR